MKKKEGFGGGHGSLYDTLEARPGALLYREGQTASVRAKDLLAARGIRKVRRLVADMGAWVRVWECVCACVCVCGNFVGVKRVRVAVKLVAIPIPHPSPPPSPRQRRRTSRR